MKICKLRTGNVATQANVVKARGGDPIALEFVVFEIKSGELGVANLNVVRQYSIALAISDLIMVEIDIAIDVREDYRTEITGCCAQGTIDLIAVERDGPYPWTYKPIQLFSMMLCETETRLGKSEIGPMFSQVS